MPSPGTNNAYIDCNELEGVFLMKKMAESVKEFFKELKHEIEVYLTIQRYIRISREYKGS